MDSSKDPGTNEIIRIGKYEIIDVLGRGGMGVVYRAMDTLLGREVAIKTLTQGVADDPEMLARFYEEGRKTARLKHPHIVTIYNLGEEKNIPYIVMERVEGEPLDRIIRTGTLLSLLDRLRIVEEVCAALGYAHSNKVIHRDVKPANIFVQPDGKAKLLDFGIARLERRSQELGLTRTGHIIGTIPYMAPERLRDRYIDGRSDIFSAGVVLFQLIAGQLPFSGDDYALMQKIINDPHPKLSTLGVTCPAGLEAIIDNALAKSADDRYQTAEEMAADLNNVIVELRQEQVNEAIPEARRLMEAEDWVRARSVLQQVLKVQGKHAEVREMLSKINQGLLKRQREDRIQQYRVQVEEALGRRDYDQSLSLIKEAFEVDPSSPELITLKERVLQEKTKQHQLDEYLKQVDTARKKGDYRAAIESAKKAAGVDKTNSQIVLLCKMLTAESEAAEKRAQAKAFLESGRMLLQSRSYSQAFEMLHKAEELDPASPEVQLLIKDAEEGLEHTRRQELVTRLEEQLSLAKSLEELRKAAQAIRESIESTPADSGLFRLSAVAERRIKEQENRQQVEDTIQACRNLRLSDAIEKVRAARQQFPTEERLLSLDRLLNQRLQEQTVDGRRAEFLSRARDELKQQKYTSAAQILEDCKAEGIANEEVLSLLEFARSEQSESLQKQSLKNAVDRAQSLIGQSLYHEAIEYLQSAVQESDAPALRFLLEEAIFTRDTLRRQVQAGLASAGRLVSGGKLGEAAYLLSGLPEQVRDSAEVQAAISAIQDEMNADFFQRLGLAYAVLPIDPLSARSVLQDIDETASARPDMSGLASAWRTRMRSTADRKLREAIQEQGKVFHTGDKSNRNDLVHTISQISDLASPGIRSEWLSVENSPTRKGLFRRVRG